MQPWRGQSALQRARVSAELDTLAQRALGNDARAPSASVIPLPDGTGTTTTASLRSSIEASAGKLLLPETTSASFGEGRNAAPATDWRQLRIGPMPDAQLVALADQAAVRISVALGVPASMLDPRAPGVGAREGRRQFSVDLLEPFAAVLAHAASEALGVDVKIRWSERPDVVSNRARTYSTLRRSPGEGQHGMDDAAARAAAGI